MLTFLSLSFKKNLFSLYEPLWWCTPQLSINVLGITCSLGYAQIRSQSGAPSKRFVLQNRFDILTSYVTTPHLSFHESNYLSVYHDKISYLSPLREIQCATSIWASVTAPSYVLHVLISGHPVRMAAAQVPKSPYCISHVDLWCNITFRARHKRNERNIIFDEHQTV